MTMKAGASHVRAKITERNDSDARGYLVSSPCSRSTVDPSRRCRPGAAGEFLAHANANCGGAQGAHPAHQLGDELVVRGGNGGH